MQDEKMNKELHALRRENACLKTKLSNVSLLLPEKNEIHNEELLLVNKMKSLGVIINGVAHDVNNTNQVISINATLLKRIWGDFKPLFYEKMKNSPDFKVGNFPGSKLEKSIDDLLLGLHNNSKRIEKIIESLKKYMRNTPNHIKETFDLYDVIENVNFLLKYHIVKATDTFTITPKNKILLINGFQQKMEQVIINVLQNACEALTSREQSIRIELDTDSADKHAIIRIVDTGSGIKSEHLDFITDPFFTTKEEIGGAGLGLSISSFIVEEHKGYFNFRSEVNNGTTVEIILPLAEDIKIFTRNKTKGTI